MMDRHWIGFGLTSNWDGFGTDWHRNDIRLELIGTGVTLDCVGLAID